MLAVDTTVLVYAHRREASEHDVAMAVIHDLAAGEASWAIPWPCLYEFFSVVTNARIAAICLAHGVEALLSRDRDFTQFPELRVKNPFKD